MICSAIVWVIAWKCPTCLSMNSNSQTYHSFLTNTLNYFQPPSDSVATLSSPEAGFHPLQHSSPINTGSPVTNDSHLQILQHHMSHIFQDLYMSLIVQECLGIWKESSRMGNVMKISKMSWKLAKCPGNSWEPKLIFVAQIQIIGISVKKIPQQNVAIINELLVYIGSKRVIDWLGRV